MRAERGKGALLGMGAAVAGVAAIAIGVGFFFLATDDLNTENSQNDQTYTYEGTYGEIVAEVEDDTIALLGTGESGAYVNIDGVEDLTFSFSSIVVDLSPVFADENLESTVTFHLDLAVEIPAVLAAGDLLGTREDSESYTYIEWSDYQESFVISDLTANDEGRFVWSPSELSFSFVWGTFYGGLNPQDYYNGLMTGDNPVVEPNKANFETVVQELNTMESAFDGFELKFTAYVEVE